MYPVETHTLEVDVQRGIYIIQLFIQSWPGSNENAQQPDRMKDISEDSLHGYISNGADIPALGARNFQAEQSPHRVPLSNEWFRKASHAVK